MDKTYLEQLCQQLLKAEKLNDTDNLVLRLSLQGQTYQQIANSSGYDNDYIRDVGYRLWRKLSKQIGIKVTKKKEYQGYGQLLETIANSHHQSCILLTGREIPSNLVSLSRNSPMIYSLQLSGLNTSECQQIIQLSGVIKSIDHSTEKLINYYGGHPLIIKIVATSIVDLFNGDLEEFWQSEIRIFGEIKDLLDQHWQRLSDLEKDVMYWLAIAREPISLNHLEKHFSSINSSSQLLTVLYSLKRKSLIKRNSKGFTQQPFIMDYITALNGGTLSSLETVV